MLSVYFWGIALFVCGSLWLLNWSERRQAEERATAMEREQQRIISDVLAKRQAAEELRQQEIEAAEQQRKERIAEVVRAHEARTRQFAEQARQQREAIEAELRKQREFWAEIDRRSAQSHQARASQSPPPRPAPVKPLPQWCQVLGLVGDVTADSINAAYRSLSKIHHPDKGGSVAKMQEINQARAVGLRWARSSPRPPLY